MPCNTRITITLEMGENIDLDCMTKALQTIYGKGVVLDKQTKRIEWYSGSFSDGKLTMRNSVDAETIKRNYTAELIKAKAARFGWNVQKTSETQFTLVKR